MSLPRSVNLLVARPCDVCCTRGRYFGGETMESVAILTHDERVWLDQEILEGMFADLGKLKAEDVVFRAVEELSLRLSTVENAYYEGNSDRILKAAKSIVGVAEQVGMTMLARVARDVVICGQEGDRIALAATLSRLMRIGDSSLAAIWDPHHLTV